MGFLNKIKGSFKNEGRKNKNFKYLDNLIHSGAKEIILDSDILLDNREEDEYSSGIKVDVDNLIIDGNGHEIDACGKARIFCCDGKNITIKNISLKNGFSKKGGAIYNMDELNIERSTLMKNIAMEYGGAIRNEGELKIEKSTLKGNNAGWGGAISNKGQLNITESKINGNIANIDGGAIQNDVEAIITKSSIYENTASNNGGAIINWYGKFTIEKSELTKNKASAGGAIYNNKLGELILNESTIDENSAENEGGAIYNKEGNFKIFNCEFSLNNSPYDIIHNIDSLQLENTNFYENLSKCTIVNYDKDKSNLSILNGEFIENNIKKSVLYNSGKFSSIEKTVFENNLSQDSSWNIINKRDISLTSPNVRDEGKTILNDGYILLKKSTPDFKNKIIGEGILEIDELIIPEGESFDFGYLDKKIHECHEKELILDKNIRFENYERDFYEGGIELDMDDLTIDGNGITIDGQEKTRFFIITGKNITLKNITFKNGRSHKNYNNPLNNNGGAIKINHNSKLTIENCNFINSISEEYGGAIHNYSELNIFKSTFKKSSSNNDGGAITNWQGNLTISESSLNENTSEHYGGAIHTLGGKVNISNSTFTKNNSRDGGGISHNDGELIIIESTFRENTANRNGGAIYQMWGNLSIINSSLNENTARWFGGAIYKRSNGEIELNETTLSDNTANRDAGAIYTENQYFQAKNCNFKNNMPNDYNE